MSTTAQIPSTIPARHPNRARITLSLCALLAASLLPGPAQADDLRLFINPGFAVSRPTNPAQQLGALSAIGLTLPITELLALTGGLEAGYLFASSIPPEDEDDDPIEIPPYLLWDAFVGLRINFDVATYVPYAQLAVVGYGGGPPATEELSSPGLGLKLTAGLLYRGWRRWSVGGHIDLHGASPNFSAFTLFSSIGMSLGYHFRL